MAATNPVTKSTIDRLARLTNLPISNEQAQELVRDVGVTVEYISTLQALPTEGVAETSQVTGLYNVFREDTIDTSRMLTQEEALANAKRTHNGYFVVDAVLEQS